MEYHAFLFSVFLMLWLLNLANSADCLLKARESKAVLSYANQPSQRCTLTIYFIRLLNSGQISLCSNYLSTKYHATTDTPLLQNPLTLCKLAGSKSVYPTSSVLLFLLVPCSSECETILKALVHLFPFFPLPSGHSGATPMWPCGK